MVLLFQTTAPVEFSETVKPVQLVSSWELGFGTKLLTIGWGNYEKAGTVSIVSHIITLFDGRSRNDVQKLLLVE